MNTTTHKSPSGKYTLTITPFTNKPGCWEYRRGVVCGEDYQGQRCVVTFNKAQLSSRLLSHVIVVGGLTTFLACHEPVREQEKFPSRSIIEVSAKEQKVEAVLCKFAQGREGEYAHFRRSRKLPWLAFHACQNFLSAYQVRFPEVAKDLFCSPTSLCPD